MPATLPPCPRWDYHPSLEQGIRILDRKKKQRNRNQPDGEIIATTAIDGGTECTGDAGFFTPVPEVELPPVIGSEEEQTSDDPGRIY